MSPNRKLIISQSMQSVHVLTVRLKKRDMFFFKLVDGDAGEYRSI